MTHIIKKDNYLGYKINPNYDIDRRHMKTIITTLRASMLNIIRPTAIRIIIGLESDLALDISKLTRKVKHAFKDSKCGLIYSFEYSQLRQHHLEVVLVFSRDSHSPTGAYLNFCKAISSIDGIKRHIDDNGQLISTVQYCKGKDYEYHNLLDDKQYNDLVTRASYLAKVDSKENIERFRSFGVIKP